MFGKYLLYHYFIIYFSKGEVGDQNVSRQEQRLLFDFTNIFHSYSSNLIA